MIKIFVSIIMILLLAGISIAQECGPNCPVCSGAGNNDGALLSQKSMLISVISIPTADEETTVANAKVGILNWLDAGIGYAFKTEKVLWNLKVQPVLEQKDSWRPGIILGTGSVQTGGSDQSIYGQLIKSLEISDAIDLQLSTGVATLVPDFDETYGLAGITTSFYDRISIFGNYDGKSFHEGISWSPSDLVSISFLMVESELPAFSIALKR